MPNATIQPAGIVVSAGVSTAQAEPLPRSLYLYENDGVQTIVPAVGSYARALYDYENDGVQTEVAGVGTNARALYDYENDGIQALVAGLMRALYDYEALRDSPVFPWLLQLIPNQQYAGGAVDIYGDGLGQFTEVGAGSTISASSTNGSNLPAYVAARSASEYWQSNDGTAAWIRFTFGTAQTIYGLALTDLAPSIGDTWGVPLFRFSDGGPDVIGGSAVPGPATIGPEYPVGASRTLYVLPTERTGITWVEVRVSSGGSGTARGLSQAWVYADQGQSAAGSVVKLIAETCGVVGQWLNRSPNWWPANSGVPPEKAVTFTVPADAVSGLVTVTET